VSFGEAKATGSITKIKTLSRSVAQRFVKSTKYLVEVEGVAVTVCPVVVFKSFIGDQE